MPENQKDGGSREDPVGPPPALGTAHDPRRRSGAPADNEGRVRGQKLEEVALAEEEELGEGPVAEDDGEAAGDDGGRDGLGDVARGDAALPGDELGDGDDEEDVGGGFEGVVEEGPGRELDGVPL